MKQKGKKQDKKGRKSPYQETSLFEPPPLYWPVSLTNTLSRCRRDCRLRSCYLSEEFGGRTNKKIKGCLIKGCLNSTKIPTVGIPTTGIPTMGIPRAGIPKVGKTLHWGSPRDRESEVRDSEDRDSESRDSLDGGKSALEIGL